MVPSTSSENL